MTNTLAPIGSLATVHRRFRTVEGIFGNGVVGNPYATEVLVDTPEIYWRLNEASGTVVADSSGNSRPGTSSGATVNQTGAFSDTGTSYSFDGTDDLITADATVPNPDATGYALELFFKRNGTGVVEWIHGMYYNSGPGHWWPGIRFNADDTLTIFAGSGADPTHTTTTTFTSGTWYHVVISVDSSDNGTFVLNGVQDMTFTATADTGLDPTLTIGEFAGDPSNEFNGNIDEIAWYDHPLSTARALVHYNARNGGGGGSPGLVGSLVKLPNKMVGGTIAPTHIMARKVFANSLAGLLAPTGNASKLLYAAIGGVLSPIGSMSKLMYQALSGVLSPLGTTTKILGRLVGGTLAPIGSMTRLMSKTITALLAPTGEKSVTTFRTILAVLSPTGQANRLYDLLITAVLDPIGTVTNLRVKLVGGTLSPTHTMIRFMERKTGIGGTLSPIGSTSKMPNRILSAVLTPVGTIQRMIPKTILATLSPTGSIQRLFSRTLAATLSPIGTIQRMFKRTVTGTLSIISSTLVNVLSFPITFFTNQMYAVTEFGEVQEASSTVLHIDWKDRNNVAMTPTFISYRIIDYYSGTTIVSDTSVTPTGSSTNIAVGPGQNAIVNNERQFEIRKVILTFGITGSQRNTEVKEYTLRNLGGVP